jgi:starvation-inducible outer membrane lipoprotein
MRALLILSLTLLLSGCMVIPGYFRNELTRVETTGELRFISFYGPVGIAAKIDTPASAPAR